MKTLFRLFCLILLCVPISFRTNAQANNSKVIGYGGTVTFIEVYDNEGNRIKMAQELGVNGTPLLHNGWGTGKVQYKNGDLLAFKSLNISLYNHQLYYTQNKKLYEIVEPIESFELKYVNEEGGDSLAFRFKNGYPVIDNQNEASLYEVLYEGDNLHLIQWNNKKVRELSNYGSTREKEYWLEQQLYVYLPKEKTISSLKQAIPSIKKTLQAYAEIINDYMSSHKGGIKGKNDLVDLMAYLDKHH